MRPVRPTLVLPAAILALAWWLSACGASETEEEEAELRLTCSRSCLRYAACGCGDKCVRWCDNYVEWQWSNCTDEIEALIRCAAEHPDPCSWELEPPESMRCRAEHDAFVGCSGNDFFPIPGATEGCAP